MDEAAGRSRPLALPLEVEAIAARLEEAGYETWAVGGALRDYLLGDPMGEVDLATAAPPDVVQRLFRATIAVGLKYGTVGVLDRHRRVHEVTTFRHDVSTDGRHAVVRFGASLREDLARRDFTINAIAYRPAGKVWEDPFHGLADLRQGLIRAVGDAALRFQEDYLRILRAVRFAARFGFAIEEATWRAAREQAAGLAGLSAERVRDEWFKGLKTARSVARLFELWRDIGAAAVWLPELRHALPPVPGPLAPEVREPVVLTALGCTDPVAVLRRLRASNHELARAEALARGPEAPGGPDEVSVRQWLRAVGPAVEDWLLLTGYRGAPPPWMDVVARVRRRGDVTSREGLALSGDDLIALGIPPGPALGALLDRLLDLVVQDPAVNTRERLLQAVRDR